MARKNPYVAALLVFFVYPLGYFYVGQFWRGLAVIFLVPLLLSPFVPKTDFAADNASVNRTVNESVNASAGESRNRNATRVDIFEEVMKPYRDNPTLIFLQVFISSIIALDCFLIAKRINAEAEGPRKEAPAVGREEASEKTQTPPDGAYYPPGVDVYCPRCKIGLAVVTPRCPNCGADLKELQGKKGKS
jgi:hypothetical protein